MGTIDTSTEAVERLLSEAQSLKPLREAEKVREALTATVRAIVAERDTFAADRKILHAERDSFAERLDDVVAQRNAAQAERDAAEDARRMAQETADKVAFYRDRCEELAEQAAQHRASVFREHEALRSENNRLREVLTALCDRAGDDTLEGVRAKWAAARAALEPVPAATSHQPTALHSQENPRDCGPQVTTPPGVAEAAPELKPCPFCGGEAKRMDIEEGENAGGSCVCCKRCQASGNVEFGFKENFISNWNRRLEPAAPTVADDWNAAIRAAEKTAEQDYTPAYGTPSQAMEWFAEAQRRGISDRILALLRPADHIADAGKMVAAPTVAEAAKVLLEALQDPDAYPGTSGIWQAAWDAMDEDHTENLDICGVSDWPSVMIAALRSVSGSAGDA